MARCSQPLRHSDNAQEAVEFALLFPILLALLMAIIEFSILFNTWIIITNGAREGARLAAVRASEAEVVDRVEAVTAGLDHSAGAFSVDVTPTFDEGAAPGTEISVTVTYQSPLITPIVATAFPGGSIPLVSQAVMRLE